MARTLKAPEVLQNETSRDVLVESMQDLFGKAGSDLRPSARRVFERAIQQFDTLGAAGLPQEDE